MLIPVTKFTNDIIYIQTTNIKFITRPKTNITSIYFQDGHYYDVKESPEEIAYLEQKFMLGASLGEKNV